MQEWTSENFHALLNNPKDLSDFKDFAARDFSSENVVFHEMYHALLFRVVDHYNKSDTRREPLDFKSVLQSPIPETFFQDFENLYDMFFKSGTDYELNVNYSTSKEIREKMKLPPAEWKMSMFADAYREIFDLLFSDTYIKFLKNKEEKR